MCVQIIIPIGINVDVNNILGKFKWNCFFFLENWQSFWKQWDLFDRLKKIFDA